MSRKVFEMSFNIAGRLASTFTSSFTSANSHMTRLKDTSRIVRESLRELERQQKNGTATTREYGRAHQNLTQHLERTAQAQKRLAESTARQNQLMQNAGDLRGQAIDTAGMALPFAGAANAAIDFETAMLGVAKQVQGARDDSGNLTKTYYDMQKEIQQLGRELPIPTNEIARMVEAGARMNVPKEQLISFTKEVAKMANAFEMPSDLIADQMGKISNVMGIPVQEISNLADTINYLDDNSVAKGGDIIEVLQRVGGQAKQVNMTADSAAALGSTFLSLGKTSEVAGTASTALLRELALANEQPERFHNALQKLGMTSEEVNQGMVDDAQGTVLKILDSINALDKKEQTAVTTGLFGKEYGDDIATLAGSVDEYRRQLGLLNEEKRKGSMDREFEARMDTTASQLEITKNRMTEAAVSLGSALLPGINEAASAFSDGASAVADFAAEHPKLTSTLVQGAAALVALKLAWVGMRMVWNQGAMAVNGVKKAMDHVNSSLTNNRTKAAASAAATRSTEAANKGAAAAARDSANANRTSAGSHQGAAAASRTSANASRTAATASRTQATASRSAATASRSAATATRSSATASRSAATATRSQATASRSAATASRSQATASRTAATANRTSATASRAAANASRTSATASRRAATAARSAGRSTRTWTVAQRALNVAMKANPIGIVITAIQILLPLLIDAYNRFDSVKKVVDTLGKVFSSVFKGATKLVSGLIDKVGDLASGIGSVLGFGGGGKGGGGKKADGSHATGLANVPFDGYRAILHRGEAVLTANQASVLRNAGMLKENGNGTPALNFGAKGNAGGSNVSSVRVGDTSSLNTSNQSINVTFAPVINGASGDVGPQLEQQQKSFMKQLQDVTHQGRRVSFG